MTADRENISDYDLANGDPEILAWIEARDREWLIISVSIELKMRKHQLQQALKASAGIERDDAFKRLSEVIIDRLLVSHTIRQRNWPKRHSIGNGFSGK